MYSTDVLLATVLARIAQNDACSFQLDTLWFSPQIYIFLQVICNGFLDGKGELRKFARYSFVHIVPHQCNPSLGRLPE